MLRSLPLVACLFGLLAFSQAHSQTYFVNPESVAFDTLQSRYFISNVGTGNIVEIDSLGNKSFFYTALTQTLGMTIVRDTLYVTDPMGVVGFDLTTDMVATLITIPGQTDLNDLTADTSGGLWVSDSYARRVYRVNLADHTSETVLSNIYWPNGLLFDAFRNRVLLCTFGTNVTIRAIDPDDYSVTNVVTTGLSDLDGITYDPEGYFYVSSFSTGRVYRYDSAFATSPVLISSGHVNPADIFYNPLDTVLVVPNWGGHTVDFLSMRDSDGDTVPEFRDNCPDQYNPDQDDSDSDGVGDVCDNCVHASNPGQENDDTDSLGNTCDNCPLVANPGQEDADGTGGGDACCCGEYAAGVSGNANCSEDGALTLSDISRVIDHVYISKAPLCCRAGGNANGSLDCKITLSDISALIDAVYISKLPPATCLALCQ